jgi:hypothetical protein
MPYFGLKGLGIMRDEKSQKILDTKSAFIYISARE